MGQLFGLLALQKDWVKVIHPTDFLIRTGADFAWVWHFLIIFEPRFTHFYVGILYGEKLCLESTIIIIFCTNITFLR